MTVSPQDYDSLLDEMDRVSSLPENEAEAALMKWLSEHENGEEILDSMLAEMLAPPERVANLVQQGLSPQEAIASLNNSNGLPQNPTNPS